MIVGAWFACGIVAVGNFIAGACYTCGIVAVGNFTVGACYTCGIVAVGNFIAGACYTCGTVAVGSFIAGARRAFSRAVRVSFTRRTCFTCSVVKDFIHGTWQTSGIVWIWYFTAHA